MNIQQQVDTALEKFSATIEKMAWGLVDEVVKQETERSADLMALRLLQGYTPILKDLNLKPYKFPTITADSINKNAKTSRVLRFAALLDSKKGLWTRDEDRFYVVKGPGKVPETYILQDTLDVHKTRIVTLKTLVSRWKNKQ